jgi:hypothetical protein
VIIDETEKSEIFTNLQRVIKIPQEIKMDYIGLELGDLFRNNFKPLPELQSEIDKIHKTFKKNMVGIHIRATEQSFEAYNWTEIIKNIGKQAKEWISKDPENNGVFLATDNPNMYVKFAIQLGNKLIFYQPPKILGGVTAEDKFGNNKLNILVAVIELYLLGKCNVAVIGTTDSTFSMAALLLSTPTTRKFMINAPENVPSFEDF